MSLVLCSQLTRPWLAQILPRPTALAGTPRPLVIAATASVGASFGPGKQHAASAELANAGARPPPRASHPAELTALLARSQSVPALLGICRDYEVSLNSIHVSAALSTAVRLLSKSGKKSEAEAAAALASLLSGRLSVLVHSCGIREASNSVWALAKLGAPVPHGVLDEVALKLAASSSLAAQPDIQPQSICSLMWALATWNHRHPRIMSSLMQLAAKQKMRGFTPRDISNFLWAAARLGPWDPRIMHVAHKATMQHLLDFTPQGLSTVVWAFGELGVPAEIRDTLLAAASRQLHSMLPQCCPQTTATYMLGVAKLGWAGPECTALFQVVQAHILGQGSSLSMWPPQVLCNLLWAFAACKQRSPRLVDAVSAALVDGRGHSDNNRGVRGSRQQRDWFSELPPAAVPEAAARLMQSLAAVHGPSPAPSASLQAAMAAAAAVLVCHGQRAPLGTAASAAASLAQVNGQPIAALTDLAVDQLHLELEQRLKQHREEVASEEECGSELLRGSNGDVAHASTRPSAAPAAEPKRARRRRFEPAQRQLLEATLATLTAMLHASHHSQGQQQQAATHDGSSSSSSTYEQQVLVLLGSYSPLMLSVATQSQLLRLTQLLLQLQLPPSEHTEALFNSINARFCRDLQRRGDQHTAAAAANFDAGAFASIKMALASAGELQQRSLQAAADHIWATQAQGLAPAHCVRLLRAFSMCDAYGTELYDILSWVIRGRQVQQAPAALAGMASAAVVPQGMEQQQAGAAASELLDPHYQHQQGQQQQQDRRLQLSASEAVQALWACAVSGHYDVQLLEGLCLAARHSTPTVSDAAPPVTESESPATIDEQAAALAAPMGTSSSSAQSALFGKPARGAREGVSTASTSTSAALPAATGTDAGPSHTFVSTAVRRAPYSDLSPSVLCQLMWSVSQLGAGLFLKWRPPPPPVLARAAAQLSPDQLAVVLWSLAVQQPVLSRGDPQQFRAALAAVMGRLATLPVGTALARQGAIRTGGGARGGGGSGASAAAAGAAEVGSLPLVLAEALSLLLASPNYAVRRQVRAALRQSGLRHLASRITRHWQAACSTPHPIRGQVEVALRQLGLQPLGQLEGLPAAHLLHTSNALRSSSPRGTSAGTGTDTDAAADMGAADSSDNDTPAPGVTHALAASGSERELAAAFGLARGSLIAVPAAGVVVVLADEDQFASNEDSHVLGPLFTLVQLLQGQGWRVRVVRTHVWKQLRSPSLRGQYLAQCLG